MAGFTPFARLDSLSLVDEAITEDVGKGCKQSANAQGYKDQSVLVRIEAVRLLEHERQGGEEGVQNGKVESNVQAQEQDDGLGEEKVHRSYQRLARPLVYGAPAQGWHLSSGSLFPFIVVLEELLFVRLFHAECEDASGNPPEDGDPFEPPPVQPFHDEATDDGSWNSISDIIQVI